MPSITEEAIKDAAEFSNFAQRVKMKYWKEPGRMAKENEIDTILLLAWNDLSQAKAQAFQAGASAVIEEIPTSVYLNQEVGIEKAKKELRQKFLKQ